MILENATSGTICVATSEGRSCVLPYRETGVPSEQTEGWHSEKEGDGSSRGEKNKARRGTEERSDKSEIAGGHYRAESLVTTNERRCCFSLDKKEGGLRAIISHYGDVAKQSRRVR